MVVERRRTLMIGYPSFFLFSILFLSLLSLSACASARMPCAQNMGMKDMMRSMDGSCNNINAPDWGAADAFFKVGAEGTEPYPWQDAPKVQQMPTFASSRMLPPQGPRPNPRKVSNRMGMRTNPSETDSINHSMFSVIFGQFVNHDFEHTKMGKDPLVTYVTDPEDPVCTMESHAPHTCYPNDKLLTIEARASEGMYSDDGHFQALNEATSYLDLSTIYGSSTQTNSQLRAHKSGKLLMERIASVSITIPGNEMPTTFRFADLLPNLAHTMLEVNPAFHMTEPSLVFTSGDSRVNENIALVFFHTLWAREHNRICDELLQKNKQWAAAPKRYDQDIFQRARAITIAKYQHIIYEEFFPSEYSEFFASQLGSYSLYKKTVDATTSNVFASAAFRYGHFTLKSWYALDKCAHSTLYNKRYSRYVPALGTTAATPEAFTPLAVLAAVGSFENVARGLIDQRSAPASMRMDEIIRTASIPMGVVDLLTFDLQRGRHNQVPNYYTLRKVYYGGRNSDLYGMSGCPQYLDSELNDVDNLACFTAITGNTTLAKQLRELYRKVNRIDGIVGLLVEEHVKGSSFGRTLGNIITDQFKRARDGDRFFYRNLLKMDFFTYFEREMILDTTMSKILERNTMGGKWIPKNPFIVPEDYRKSFEDMCPKKSQQEDEYRRYGVGGEQ